MFSTQYLEAAVTARRDAFEKEARSAGRARVARQRRFRVTGAPARRAATSQPALTVEHARAVERNLDGVGERTLCCAR